MQRLAETWNHFAANWKLYVPAALAIGGVLQSVYHCFDPHFCEAVIGIAAALGIASTGHNPQGSDQTTPPG